MNNQQNFLKKHYQKFVALIFWGGLLGFYFWYTDHQQISLLQTFTQFISFIKENPWGPVIFITIYTLRPIIFFSAVVLTVAGGFLFGPLLGFIFTVIGSNSGASLAYAIGRFFSPSNLEDKGQGFIQRYADKLRANSFETILIMRFIFLPYDLVNYLAGILKVRYSAFILATILGSIPGTLAFVLIGAAAPDEFDFSTGFPKPKPWVLLASIIIFMVSIALSRFFKKKEATV